MSVLVLMSTYNGEKYIKTQLDSILAQDYKDINILIRDDGSTDSTPDILEMYSSKYAAIDWYRGENIGVKKSFFELMLNADRNIDYYAFADQDDKWLNQKISRAVCILKKYSPKEATLYCSDKIIVNENLNTIHVTVDRLVKNTSFGNALVQNICTGCTAVMNRRLLEMICQFPPQYVIMHDWWFYLVASCFGNVYYDQQSYILYRQHGKNTLGAMLNKKELFIYRMKQLRRPRGEIFRQAKEFQKLFVQESATLIEDSRRPIMTFNNLRLLKTFLMSEKSMRYRIQVILTPQIFRQKTYDNFILRLIILIGKL